MGSGTSCDIPSGDVPHGTRLLWWKAPPTGLGEDHRAREIILGRAACGRRHPRCCPNDSAAAPLNPRLVYLLPTRGFSSALPSSSGRFSRLRGVRRLVFSINPVLFWIAWFLFCPSSVLGCFSPPLAGPVGPRPPCPLSALLWPLLLSPPLFRRSSLPGSPRLARNKVCVMPVIRFQFLSAQGFPGTH